MTKKPALRRFERHIRTRLISGLIVLIPVWITVVLFTALLRIIAGPLSRVVAKFLPAETYAAFAPAISIAVVILLIYLVGAVTAHVFGRRLVALAEAVFLHIPVIRTIYSAAKQVVDTISLADNAAFKSVVMLDFPRAGMKALGFVTGTVRDESGRTLCKVFVPTSPNPTTGFLQIMAPDTLMATDLSVETGLKMIVSGGVISPDRITTSPFSLPETETNRGSSASASGPHKGSKG